MLRVGRARAKKANIQGPRLGRKRRRAARVAERLRRRLHDRLWHPQRDHRDRALAEARRVLRPGGRLMVLEFSLAGGSGARRDLRALFVFGDPEPRPARCRGCRQLPLSRREHPALSAPGSLRRGNLRGRLLARRVPKSVGRNCCHSFRLGPVISDFGHVWRLAGAGLVLARYENRLPDELRRQIPFPIKIAGAFARLFGGSTNRASADKPSRLASSLTRLGPAYVKLGQFLATRPDVLGPELAAELRSLQDRMPPFAQAQSVAIIERELGKPLSEIYSEFSEPIAAASIAQVHRARLASGGDAGRGQSFASRRREGFCARSLGLCLCGAQGREREPGRKAPGTRRARPDARGERQDGTRPAVRRRRCIRDRRSVAHRRRLLCSRDSLVADRAARPDDAMDRCHSDGGSGGDRWRRHRPSGAGAPADGRFS